MLTLCCTLYFFLYPFLFYTKLLTKQFHKVGNFIFTFMLFQLIHSNLRYFFSANIISSFFLWLLFKTLFNWADHTHLFCQTSLTTTQVHTGTDISPLRPSPSLPLTATIGLSKWMPRSSAPFPKSGSQALLALQHLAELVTINRF